MNESSSDSAAMRWGDFAETIDSIYDGPHRAVGTRKKMEFVLRQARGLGAESPADLTTAFMARYVSTRSDAVCLNTVRGELRYLKAAVNLAIEEEWIAKGPKWRRIWPRKSQKVRAVLHPVADVAAVLGHLRALATNWEGWRLYSLFAVYAYTGLRKREALYLRMQDVRLEDRIIEVAYRDDFRLKTVDSEGPVPIPEELAEILARWLPQAGPDWVFPGRRGRGPWEGGSYGSRPTESIRLAAEAVGVRSMTPFSLRGTFSTWARKRWGLNGRQLMAILRHTTEATQEAYVHQETSDLVASVARVSYRT